VDYAAMRLTENYFLSSSTNLMPLCGEASHFVVVGVLSNNQ
jgi:hypothetical protein